jgi:hypothetical protein
VDIPIDEILTRLRGLNQDNLADIGVVAFTVILSISLLSSLLISSLYLQFYGSRATGSQIHRSFPLLGISVTAIFICIQFSLPLSLGLLGALSIVRFRTPIKEPEEIGFIMLVIACSIAAATFSLYFLLVLLIVAIVALLIQKIGISWINRETEDGLLLFTVTSDIYQDKMSDLGSLLDEFLIRGRLESITKSDQESVVSYSFSGIRNGSVSDLQRAIGKLVNPKTINIYFTKQATL